MSLKNVIPIPKNFLQYFPARKMFSKLDCLIMTRSFAYHLPVTHFSSFKSILIHFFEHITARKPYRNINRTLNNIYNYYNIY